VEINNEKMYLYNIIAYNWGNIISPTEDFVTLAIEAGSEDQAFRRAKKVVTRQVYKISDIKQLDNN
jgi:hypothetical protein